MQIATIVLTPDKPSTGLDPLTLTPIQSVPSASYREQSSAKAVIGEDMIVITFSPDKGSGLSKTRVIWTVPVMESAGPSNADGYTAAPKVAFTLKADCTFFLPSRSTTPERTALLNYFIEALKNQQIADTVVNLAPPY